jgi:hypothetical protein
METIEDIGKEADKWDEDEPLGADDEFTVGISVDDRKRMLAVIRSAPKRQLARAVHVSSRTIPSSVAEANEMTDQDLRRIFVRRVHWRRKSERNASLMRRCCNGLLSR